jgi:outer membrane protein assembly factor BamB
MSPARILLLALCLTSAALAHRPRPAPCTGGRFSLRIARPLAAGSPDVLVLRDGTASIDPVCPAVPVTLKATRRGTVVRAVWSDCLGVGGRVRLKGRLTRACDGLRGALHLSARPRTRRVKGVRSPYDVPLDPRSPWPKFRRDAAQDARGPVHPQLDGGHLWTFHTGKGIFSSPVVDGDGNVYVGSADRTFYALAPDGSVRWQLLTGEIIDSAALLDDRGRVYFGSGDGRLYARDAASGAPVWTFAADPASATGAFINWFEGNVAMGDDGTLYVPNDNFLTYAIDRDTMAVRWRFRTADQTWSVPALNASTQRLFLGNNFQLFTPNTFALDAATGMPAWQAAVSGSVAASPMLTADGKVLVGGFDGFLRCYDQATGVPCWSFGARDHIYASPAQLPDGTIVQPSADGTVYGLDPASGALRWQFDTRDAIRSSPAIDADGNVYVGSGEGQLFVLNPDGTLRWSMRLIDGPRDDLNASPALGPDAIVVAGESGDVFSIPYDWCLRPAAAGDVRCRRGPGEELPDDGAFLSWTTQFGRALDTPPAEIEANQPMTFSLLVRRGGDTQLALIDTMSVHVTLEPPAPIRVEVSGDRKFLTVIPEGRLAGSAGGPLRITVTGNYLVNPARDGLRFTGGTVGGSFSEQADVRVRPAPDGGAFPLPVPAAPGDPAGIWEISRVAVPLPTILPSYNQIGFDSIHYLAGLVEADGAGHAVAWVVGARLAEGENRTEVDPSTRVLFPLEVTHDGGLLTLENDGGFAIEFNAIRIPFDFFRLATRVDAQGRALDSPALNVLTPCSGIEFYGTFFRQLGFCNPDTDILDAFGGTELAPLGDGTQEPPAGVGAVTFTADPTGVSATLAGSSLRADAHSVAIVLIDAATGRPVSLDYGFTTARTTAPDGTVSGVRLPFGGRAMPPSVRAYLMVDAYPASRADVAIPPPS